MNLIEGVTAYQGNQVPFTLTWVNGHPDFTTIDRAKVTACLIEGLCGICGEELGDQVAFVGGHNSTAFHDPPNHPVCADVAFTHCPFLKNHRMRDAADSGDYQMFLASGYMYDPVSLVSWPTNGT